MRQSEGGGKLDAQACVDQEDGHDAGTEEGVLCTHKKENAVPNSENEAFLRSKTGEPTQIGTFIDLDPSHSRCQGAVLQVISSTS